MDAINRWVDDESVWLSQKLIAELFDTTGSNITTHLNNILEHELDRNSVCKDFLHIVAEVIVERMNHKKEHMGLTTWKNSPDGLIYKYDVVVAKNYLNEKELNKLNDLTNMFLVFAEDEAKERHVMTMQDWINATDDLLRFRRKGVLKHSGNVSHKQAVEKAESEYEKYRVIQDQQYISTMDEFYNKYLKENNKVGEENE